MNRSVGPAVSPRWWPAAGPATRVGWLLLATGLPLALSGAVSGYRWYGTVLRTRPTATGPGP